MTSADRRREKRIPVNSATFILKCSQQKEVRCKVHNLSRLGVGILTPLDFSEDSFVTGAHINGVLEIGDVSLNSRAVIRVRKNQFAGLEYTQPSREFVNALTGILSPKAVAHAIEAVPADTLASHLEYAFRGPDFEVVAFKTGKSGVKNMLQIFVSGRMVEIYGNDARAVPAPLVRPSGMDGGFEFVSEFNRSQEEESDVDLQLFFEWLWAIVEEWPQCPPSLSAIVAEQRTKFV